MLPASPLTNSPDFRPLNSQTFVTAARSRLPSLWMQTMESPTLTWPPVILPMAMRPT